MTISYSSVWGSRLSTVLRRIAAVPCAALLLAAAPVPRWGPNGNGTLDHSDDLRWTAFNNATVSADDAKGVYRARFGAALASMDGKVMRITGYMLPVEPTTHAAHFILTRRSTGCPFCPPNEPTEAIEIHASAPADYTQAPVTLEGRLHLVAQSEAGLFYRIDGAKII